MEQINGLQRDLKDWIARHLPSVPVQFTFPGNMLHRYQKKAGSLSVALFVNRPKLDTVEQWNRICDLSEQFSLPLRIFGGGTNLYITEEGFDGLVVIYKYRAPVQINTVEGKVICTASTPLAYVVQQACRNGLDMVELCGIPGTVGGAVFNNAGNSRSGINIGHIVETIELFNISQRCIEIVKPSPASWVQRGSFFKRSRQMDDQHYVIRKAVLKPEVREPEQLLLKLKRQNHYRAKKNRHASHNAGSFWVNRIENKLGPNVLTRDFIGKSALATINVNDVHYTQAYSFLDTASHSTDRDVATVIKQSLSILQEEFSENVEKEVEFLGQHGELDLETFLENR